MNASARPTSAMLTLPAGARMPESCHSPVGGARVALTALTLTALLFFVV